MTPLLRSMPPGPVGFHSTARHSSGFGAMTTAGGMRAGSALAASGHAAGGAARGPGQARQASAASESSQVASSPPQQALNADARASRAPRTSPLSLSAPAQRGSEGNRSPAVESAAVAAAVARAATSPDASATMGPCHQQAAALAAPNASDVDAGTGAAAGCSEDGSGLSALESDATAAGAVRGQAVHAAALAAPQPQALPQPQPQPVMHASSSRTDFLGGSDGDAGEGSHSGVGGVAPDAEDHGAIA